MHDIHGHMISCETEDTVGCLGCLHFYVYFVSHQATTCVCVCVKHCQLKWLICRHIKTIHAQENSFWKAVQCSDHYVWKSHKRDCIFLKVVAYSLKTNQCFKIRIPFIHSSIHLLFFLKLSTAYHLFSTQCAYVWVELTWVEVFDWFNHLLSIAVFSWSVLIRPTSSTWSSVLSPVAPLWSPLPTLLICLHGTLFVSLSVFGWHTFNFICLPSLVQPVLLTFTLLCLVLGP